jgi:hypothetical protein
MATIQVTISDITKGPFQLRALFGLNASLPAGVSVTPSFTAAAPSGAPLLPASIQMQNNSSGSQVVYWGDKNLSGAAALQLTAGGSAAKSFVPTDGEYINASANSAVIAIAADGGTA